ncbi:hypothetical protein BD626DRAFT_563795 [Schizophyllum amplum]|uniref:Ketoreductase domain-containing protein n=1 Tax=Schizophyllum amplum TaxID=97359 RepID=A0A550CZ89_9AGAR|nr:hypothetical protein BD626DRAFT_563795 [Auriculariopsis ampla]
MAANLTNRTLNGKAAIVTGSSRGIGEEIAYELGKNGAKVMITYTSPSSATLARSLATRISELENGAEAATVRADLRLPESPAAIIHATLDAFSVQTIDILVNNAGVELVRPLVGTTAADFTNVFDVNVRAVIFMTEAVIPYLRAPARIINVSSVAARRGYAGYTMYCASKGALEAFTRACAAELGGAGHSVNAVAPGPVLSDMFDSIPVEFVEAQKQRTAMQNRVGTTGDVAPIVAWLAQENSRWVTGQTLSATGGCEML